MCLLFSYLELSTFLWREGRMNKQGGLSEVREEHGLLLNSLAGAQYTGYVLPCKTAHDSHHDFKPQQRRLFCFVLIFERLGLQVELFHKDFIGTLVKKKYC